MMMVVMESVQQVAHFIDRGRGGESHDNAEGDATFAARTQGHICTRRLCEVGKAAKTV